MRRSRITITVSTDILKKIDAFADGEKIRNRSHAVEYVITDYFKTKIKTAVILAGGQGAKLRPFTYELPKALLPIKGRPLLEYIIENCKNSDLTNIFICGGYLDEKIREHFGDGKRFGVSITYSQEKEPLKTGGALLKIKEKVPMEPFFVINGDVLTDLPFHELAAFYTMNRSVATVALTSVHEPEAFGQLDMHGTKLVRFYQKNKKTNAHAPISIRSHLVNAGIYIFEPSVFEYFPQNKKSFYLEDVIEKLVLQKKVNGFVFDEEWFDVGDPRSYENAIKSFRVK